MSVAMLCLVVLLLSLQTTRVSASPPPPVVVEDLGGASALPYYRALNLQHRASARSDAQRPVPPPPPPTRTYREGDFLPVHSEHLTPGPVAARVIEMPGITPMFLIGDDLRSRTWLRERLEELRELRAIGFVVSVETEGALASLRRLATGLTLVPASAEDTARRLGITHYPVLITPTGIEQ